MEIKVKAELLQDAVNVIANAHHEKYSFAQINTLLQALSNCPQIEDEVKEEVKPKAITKAKG